MWCHESYSWKMRTNAIAQYLRLDEKSQRFVERKSVFHFCFSLTSNYLFYNLIFFSIDSHQLCVLRVLITAGTPHTIYHHLQTHNATQASVHTLLLVVFLLWHRQTDRNRVEASSMFAVIFIFSCLTAAFKHLGSGILPNAHRRGLKAPLLLYFHLSRPCFVSLGWEICRWILRSDYIIQRRLPYMDQIHR